MAAIASAVVRKFREMLTDSTGLSYTIAAIAEREQFELAAIGPEQVIAECIAADLAERTSGAAYPAVYVFCEAIENLLREKFRTFSGKAWVAAEIRVTHDRPERIPREVELYAAAVTEILDGRRGDWGGGMFFAGGYRVAFGPVKRGGRNFAQAARITFEVDVSV